MEKIEDNRSKSDESAVTFDGASSMVALDVELLKEIGLESLERLPAWNKYFFNFSERFYIPYELLVTPSFTDVPLTLNIWTVLC